MKLISSTPLLRLYRLAILLLIAWVIRAHHERLRVTGDAPVRLAEVKSFFTNAAAIEIETNHRPDWTVFDRDGLAIGYVACTQPACRRIIGYCGVTDVLIAFDSEWRIKGIQIRSSEDTIRHVEDVATDRHFMKTWNGMTWDEVAQQDLKKAGIEGVSGATQTSLAIAESIVHRLALAREQARPLGWTVRARDAGLAAVAGLGLALAFWRAPHYRWVRRGFQALVILYVGFVTGDLIAQSLLAGWMKSGVGWRLAPGLCLLVAAAFAVPWATGKPWYCQHFCPHGMLQEWAGRLGGGRLRAKIPPALDAGLRRLPAALLFVVLAVVMWRLPLDPAALEPFDAFTTWGGATLVIAIAGLAASLFVPQAYCHYGCPTGALLEFVRSRGAADRFGARDWTALAFLAVALLLARYHDVYGAWLKS